MAAIRFGGPWRGTPSVGRTIFGSGMRGLSRRSLSGCFGSSPVPVPAASAAGPVARNSRRLGWDRADVMVDPVFRYEIYSALHQACRRVCALLCSLAIPVLQPLGPPSVLNCQPHFFHSPEIIGILLI